MVRFRDPPQLVEDMKLCIIRSCVCVLAGFSFCLPSLRSVRHREVHGGGRTRRLSDPLGRPELRHCHGGSHHRGVFRGKTESRRAPSGSGFSFLLCSFNDIPEG